MHHEPAQIASLPHGPGLVLVCQLVVEGGYACEVSMSPFENRDFDL